MTNEREMVLEKSGKNMITRDGKMELGGKEYMNTIRD